MRHHRILVGLDPKTGFVFKSAEAKQVIRTAADMLQLPDAKFIQSMPGDTVSWEAGPMPKGTPAVTGLTVDFFGVSPFVGPRAKFPGKSTRAARKVSVSAVGHYYPYEVTLEPLGLKADPGVGVDEPGQFSTEEVGVLARNGEITFPAAEVPAASLLRFGCSNEDGDPVDFQITFGDMAPEQWPVYPPVDYSTPIASVPGFGVTSYVQVKPVQERTSFAFTAYWNRAVAGHGTIVVTPAVVEHG